MFIQDGQNELITVDELKELLNSYKGILNKEMFEYLDSIINSEFSVIKENISERDRKALSELEIYKKAAIYNIYSRAINLLEDKNLDIIPLNNRLDINSKTGDRLFNFSFGEYNVFGNRDIPDGYKTMKIGNVDLYHTLEGKEQKEVLAKALEELELTENDVMYYFSKEKAGLLKKEVIKLHLFEVKDVAEFIKEFLTQTTKDMGLDVQFESSIRDKQISIKMYSDNNSILIGHEGKTLKALTTVIKQVVYNKVGEYPYLLLDVENYKAKQEKYLIRLAKNIAKEVGHTKVEVELEDMNSYERRIIHNALTDNKYVYTESTGVEPHRHIVIKPKEQ